MPTAPAPQRPSQAFLAAAFDHAAPAGHRLDRHGAGRGHALGHFHKADMNSRPAAIELRNLTLGYDKHPPCTMSRSPSSQVRWWRSSAPTAPASRRWSRRWPASCARCRDRSTACAASASPTCRSSRRWTAASRSACGTWSPWVCGTGRCAGPLQCFAIAALPRGAGAGRPGRFREARARHALGRPVPARAVRAADAAGRARRAARRALRRGRCRTQADLVALLHRWHDAGKTVIAVLHDLPQVREHFRRR